MLGGLKLGTRVWERRASAGENAEAIEAARRFLRHELSSIYPRWEGDSLNRGHVAFEGTTQRLAFIGPPPAPIAPAGNQRFELTTSLDHALALTWQSDSTLDSPSPARATLLSRVESIDLAYFGPDPTGRSLRWWDSWTGRTALPQLIRLRVRFPAGDGRQWPDLVVHPEIMVDVGCVYDPISRGCRGR